MSDERCLVSGLNARTIREGFSPSRAGFRRTGAAQHQVPVLPDTAGNSFNRQVLCVCRVMAI